MNASINPSHFLDRPANGPKRMIDDCLRLAARAGFKALDFTGSYKTPEGLEETRRQRELLDSLGVAAKQSHAPFNRYRTYPDSEFPALFHRSFASSAILGVKYVVVHADEYRSVERYDRREIVEFTYNYLAPELEFAKKHGMKLAIENLFEDLPSGLKRFDGKSRFTSRVEEVIAIIERFNDPDVVCCWDFGHAAVSFGNGMTDALKSAAKYVKCTHVHDNYLNSDSHMLPFTGKIDWKAEMAVLADAGYNGNISLELVYDRMPDELLPDWLSLCEKTAVRLAAMCHGK